MENHDKIIIDAIYKGKLPKAKYLKNNERYINITEYLFTRFEYVDSLKESLDRIKFNKEIRPTCKECGNKVKYLGLNKGNLIYRDFCCSKCSNSNKSKQQKSKDTCIFKYGVDNPWKNKEVIKKCNKTKVINNQSKYKVDNVMQIDEVKKKSIENQHKTNQERYGVNSVFAIPKIHKKCEDSYKDTCLERYGVDNYSKTNEFLDKIKKTNHKRYGVDFTFQDDEVKRKISKSREKTCLNRYGVVNYLLSNEYKERIEEIVSKITSTKRKNHSFNTSSTEDKIYELLCQGYEVQRNWNKDERYPWMCDFYVEGIDLFIECNFHWTHGGHPFDSSSIKDQVKISQWKSKGTKYYDNAIETWTIRDVEKRTKAKEEGLNYVELWSYEEAVEYIKKNLL